LSFSRSFISFSLLLKTSPKNESGKTVATLFCIREGLRLFSAFIAAKRSEELAYD